MSREAVEIVNRWAQAFNQREMQALLEVTTADFKFTPYLANLIETTTYQGHDGLHKYFEDADSAWEGIQIHLKDVRPAPDNRVFVAGELRARGRASGAEVRVAVAWAGGIRENKLAWASTFDSEAEALEAAGPFRPRKRQNPAQKRGLVAPLRGFEPRFPD